MPSVSCSTCCSAGERWDRTVVLVTSDHGEAFGEHGRMGHNSTRLRRDAPRPVHSPCARRSASAGG